MAWTLVNKSASVNTGTTGTTTPTLPAASVAGSLLVACLISATGGTQFTGPAGWIQGPQIGNSTFARAEIWYYPNNPGGISSAAFTSGSGSVKGMLSQFSGGNGSLSASGSGTAGAVGTVSVSTTGSPAAGDLSIACFDIRFTSNTSGTWTPDGNYTLVNSEQGATTSHPLGEYRLLVPGGATESAGATFSAVATQGWAMAIATFMLLPPIPVWREHLAGLRPDTTTESKRPDQTITSTRPDAGPESKRNVS